MPSNFDTGAQHRLSKPTYDSEEDRKYYETKREAEEILELKPAPLPTAEMEVEYIDWLKDSFKSDPWVHYRFRKLMAGPKRIPWKNSYEIKKQYQQKFFTNWLIGGLLFWPLGVMVGRRMKRTQFGVPLPATNTRMIDSFINVEPSRVARETFGFWSVLTCIAGGYLFARQTVDPNEINSNQWYTRPDLKPYPAMVKQDEDDVTRLSLERALYDKRRNTGDENKGLLRRYFFPSEADFTLKVNPYRDAHPDDVFKKGQTYYNVSTNDFRDHIRE